MLKPKAKKLKQENKYMYSAAKSRETESQTPELSPSHYGMDFSVT